MNELSSLLFARPSFLEGVGRAIDLGGTLVEFNRISPAQADAIALASDWRAVGEDLAQAMDSTDGTKGEAG